MNDKSLNLSKLFNNGNLKKIIKEIKNLFLNYLVRWENRIIVCIVQFFKYPFSR